jgi:hypothetical protein
METNFETIRTVLAIFGENAFYCISITSHNIRFQGKLDRDSYRLAVGAGYIKCDTNYIEFRKDKNTLIFT